MKKLNLPTVTRYVIVLVIGVCLSACNGSKLPGDPGLQGEDFGIGIRLGIPMDSAREIAQHEADSLEIMVLSRDELASQSPYDLRSSTGDLVLAVYTGIDGGEDGPAIEELRCYLADPEDSHLTLLGSKAALLSASDVIDMLGQPLQRTETSEGEIHLAYRFGLVERKDVLELVTSHMIGGPCFAVALSLEPRL